MKRSGFQPSPGYGLASRVQGSVRKAEGGRRKDERTFLPPLTRGGRGGWATRATLVFVAALASSVAFLVVVARAQEVPATRPAGEPASKPAIRFTYVDVLIDTKDQPLAAYQFELAAEKGDVKIVGIEGGEHAAFKAPPYYDPAAMSRDHVIIAAFNTGKDLPKGKTRVARVHVQITGEIKPEYVLKLEVAASSEGQPISGATATVSEGGSR